MTNSDFTETGMHGQPAAPRQFVAHPPFLGSKMATKTMAVYKNPVKLVVFMAVAVVGIFAFCFVAAKLYNLVIGSNEGAAADVLDHVVRWGAVVLIAGGTYAYYRWHQGKKILLSLTGAGLTVDKWPGDVFSPRDAQLGPWAMPGGGMTMGTALHLQSGAHRFVLGVRDHRPAAGTRLEAPPEYNVDAWLWAKDFGEGLALFAGGSAVSDGSAGGALQAAAPVPGGPIRCVLYPNPLLVQQMGSFAFMKRQKLLNSTSQPQLALDLRDDAIHAIDPNTNALIASAALASVTATPATYKPSFGPYVRSPQQVLSNAMGRYFSTQPVLVINIPGSQPLAIGCSDTTDGYKRRFSWRGDAPVSKDPAPYTASGGDWQLLVEKLGLAQYLETNA